MGIQVVYLNKPYTILGINKESGHINLGDKSYALWALTGDTITVGQSEIRVKNTAWIHRVSVKDIRPMYCFDKVLELYGSLSEKKKGLIIMSPGILASLITISVLLIRHPKIISHIILIVLTVLAVCCIAALFFTGLDKLNSQYEKIDI